MIYANVQLTRSERELIRRCLRLWTDALPARDGETDTPSECVAAQVGRDAASDLITRLYDADAEQAKEHQAYMEAITSGSAF